MQTIGSIFKNQMKGSPFWKKVGASVVVEETNRALAEILGPEAVKYARAAYVKNGVLAIACLSSVVAQEVRLNEPGLLAALHKKFPNQVIKVRYLA